MLNTQEYRPFTAYGNYGDPEQIFSPEMALASGRVAVEAIPQPAMQLAKRYEPRILDNMYQAWEQTKNSIGEIQEQFIASRYYHSKQWTDAELRELKRRRQPPETKNRIKRKIDFLVGVEQRLRRDPKCYPRNPSAEKASYVATAALRAVEDETKWPAIASAASKDALIRGIGVIWQGARIVKNRAEVRKAHVPSDRFFYDPCSEAWDFSDARYMGEWQWSDMDQAKEMLPFAAEMIDLLASMRNEGSLSMLPQEFAKSRNWITWVNADRRIIRITHIWYRYCGEWMFDYLVGPISLCPQDYDCKSPYIGEDGNTDHPYNAWSPYVDESGIRYGVTRDMIPLQDGINKRSSKMLHLLNSRQTIGTKGAVDDVDAMKRESGRPDGHIEVNPGPNHRFDFVDQSAQTQGQFELLQEDKAEIENLGPNPGLIGRGVENQSGRAILAQQNSGMTELSPVFENLREWKLNVYHKDWRLIRQFWTGERYIRVTSDPKAVEFLSINRLVEDPMTGQISMENAIAEMDMDLILDEGPDTVTMREELLNALSNRPDVPLEMIIELSTLPDKEVVLKRLQEANAPPPQLVAMQDRMAKLEAALKASQVDESIANIENKRADTISKLVTAGAPPIVMKAFPLSYGQPSTLDRLQGATEQSQNALMQAENEGAGMAGPEGQRPQNALMGGMGQSDQPALPGQEPSIDQAGGLPLGPGVGP